MKIVFEFRGLSTDTKPLGADLTNRNLKANTIISNGSVFIEIDTGDVYMLAVTDNGDGTYTGEWLLFLKGDY